MNTVAIYARYSSDHQRDASIEDQLRLCAERAEREGWTVAKSYADHAVSGGSLLLRPGIQELLSDAQAGKFDIVLAEALDRLSRDQEDIAGVYKRLGFAGVRIITLSEGEINELHVGLKGTMNALQLKDLADKTRRGLRGRVENGKSGGGKSYGYDVVNELKDGALVRGERRINEFQAGVIRRIFTEYATGKSPRAIARALNADHIAGPTGKPWGPSTIHGNRRRGTGILNNELYTGRLVWNRLRFIKDPDTGKRVSRPNPECEWIIKNVPELRIVESALWDKVKARQAALDARPAGNWNRRRPRYLFSGLMKCGECGGGAVVWSRQYIGCAAARNKGTCTNKTTIRRDELESMVLDGLQNRLMDPALMEIFCDEFTREVNRLRRAQNTARDGIRTELEKVEGELDRLIQAIMDGVPGISLKDKIGALEDRKAALQTRLASTPEEKVALHPGMAQVFRDQIGGLRETLGDPSQRSEAADVLRRAIDYIELVPIEVDGRKRLSANLYGEVAEILSMAANLTGEQLEGTGVAEICTKMVAGAGFEPATFGL